MAFINAETGLHDRARPHNGYRAVDECGVRDVDLEKRRIVGVEAVEMYSLDENNSTHEFRFCRVRISLERYREGVV